MKDLRISYLVDLYPLDTVVPVTGSSPTRALATSRFDIRGTAEVRVNGTTSPLIIIKTVHTVEFELPSPYDTHPLGELTVDLLGTDFSGRTEAKMLLTLSARPRAVTGTQKLVQLVMKILLTNSGTDRFSPRQGGDLRRLIGVTTDPRSIQAAQAKFYEAISRTEKRVLEAQAGTAVPSLERLKSLRAGSLTISAKGAMTGSVILESVGGAPVTVPVVI